MTLPDVNASSAPEVQGTLMGFDYGPTHIGVAIGQTVTHTATALTSLNAKAAKPDWEGITRLIENWQPAALVVGEPLNMDGTEQPMTSRARRFSRQLHGRFALPVFLADERLSSREARSRLPRGADPRDDHAVAAQIILETWLGNEGHLGSTNEHPGESRQR